MSTGRATLQSQLPLSDEMPSWNREEFKHSRDIYVTVCFFWLFFTGIPLFYFFVMNAPNNNGRTVWTLITFDHARLCNHDVCIPYHSNPAHEPVSDLA
jgi:hypothetical protein